VTCQTTTTAGDTVTKSADVIVQDTTPPQITVPANVSVTTGDPSGATVSYGAATATDVVDGALTPTCAPTSGSKFPVGTTTVTCTATDSHGNTGSASFTVTVTLSDSSAPVVTVPSSFTVTTENPAGASATYTATATDDVDGPLTPACSPASGSTFPVGTTTVTCTATDSHGNTGSASFQITVVLTDTTAPVLTVPGDFTVPIMSGSGTAVSYTASATDNLDGAIAPVCTPASGSTFPLGATTVTCTATDAHGNTAQKSFTVTVVLVDTTPPSFSNVPGHIRREADGPAGSVVTYTSPTAVDSLDGPVPVSCAPASGATFRLGTTTVTCTATDAHGNTATARFDVTIVDTTPPRLVVPPDSFVYAETPDGISAAAAAVQAFLGVAAATDLADPHPTVTNDAPSFLPVGATTITFTAQDASGNTTRATAVLTVKPQPPPGTPQPPPPSVDRTAPDDVAALKAKVGNRFVRLTWKKPKASDFDHVEITRSPAELDSAARTVYRGAATSFRDRGLANGSAYRYVVVSVDHTGNASAGVAITATPKRLLLISPADGAKVKAPPKLAWVASAGADYYNVQLYRGRTKILSVWPATTSYQLKKAWKFEGRRYRLSAGLYRWYVWPGIGAKSAARYGPLLGTSTFQIVSS
jgi:HYR domain